MVGAADVFISIVSPILGLLIVGIIFWIDFVSEHGPNPIPVVAEGFLFLSAWGFGIWILWEGLNQYMENGVISAGQHSFMLGFLAWISLVFLLVLGHGIYRSILT